MEEQKVKEELIRRYIYLYDNKELILSLCISAGIEEKSLKRRLQEAKATLKSYKKNGINNQAMLSMLMKSIEQIKESLDNPKFYLKDEIPKELLQMIEDFLFTDYPLETTDLYKEIENMRSDEVELANAEYLINDINSTREKNIFLRKRQIFTVWHILDYIRKKHPNNQDIQEYLDIFYNLERYMLTGFDWESGYYLEKYDEEAHESYIDAYPHYIVSGVKTKFDESYIMTSYKGNEFEHEDEYFESIEFSPHPRIVNNYPTSFVYKAIRLEPISESDKKILYTELRGKTKIFSSKGE